MLAVGSGVAFLGYAIFYYGLTQVQGGNWGFLDLVIPSRWTPEIAATPKDGGVSAGSSSAVSTGTSSVSAVVEAANLEANPVAGLAGLLK
jgi:hypothetical protein